MKYLILSLFITALGFAQVDSMRTIWTQATEGDLYGTILYADTSTGATTAIDTILAGTEVYEWQPAYAGLWRVRMASMDSSSNVSGYSVEDTVTIWRDSIPTQFAFHDSVDAAVSSQIISLPVVLAGFNDAYVTVIGGDYRLSVLDAWTRISTRAFLGDTLWAVDTSSASNSTATNVIVSIAGISDTFTVTTIAGASGYTTDSLLYYWDDDSLSNGSVVSWLDSVSSFELARAITDQRPTMTDSGVVYDGGDQLRTATIAPMDSTMSFEVVVKVVDTTSVNGYVIFGARTFSVNGTLGTISIHDGKLCFAIYRSSSEFKIGVYATPILNQFVHIVATSDGVGNELKLYINGEEATVVVTNKGAITPADRIELGGENYVPNGTIIRLARYYGGKTLTQEEVTANYNSVSGKLP